MWVRGGKAKGLRVEGPSSSVRFHQIQSTTEAVSKNVNDINRKRIENRKVGNSMDGI